MQKIIYLSFVLLIITASCKKPIGNATEIYFPTVKTIINNNCKSCHNSTDASGWPGRPVKFDTDMDITAGYVAIKASVADPASPTNRRMPQSGSLPAADIDVIVKWFNKGGKSTD